MEAASVLGERVVDDELGFALVVARRRQLLLGGRAVIGSRGDVGDERVQGGEVTSSELCQRFWMPSTRSRISSAVEWWQVRQDELIVSSLAIGLMI